MNEMNDEEKTQAFGEFLRAVGDLMAAGMGNHSPNAKAVCDGLKAGRVKLEITIELTPVQSVVCNVVGTGEKASECVELFQVRSEQAAPKWLN